MVAIGDVHYMATSFQKGGNTESHYYIVIGISPGVSAGHETVYACMVTTWEQEKYSKLVSHKNQETIVVLDPSEASFLKHKSIVDCFARPYVIAVDSEKIATCSAEVVQRIQGAYCASPKVPLAMKNVLSSSAG